MAYKHPDIIKNSPYYDDFDDTKNFLQVLFKPGYSVQARELTQLQTILQNQISKSSDHIFIDGTKVYGGNVSIGTYFYGRIKNSQVRDSNNNLINVDWTNKDVCLQYFYDSTNKEYRSFAPSVGTLEGTTTTYTARNTTSASISNLDRDFQLQIVDVLPKTVTEDLIIIFKLIKGAVQDLLAFKIDDSYILKVTEITKGNYTALDGLEVKTTSNNPINFEFAKRHIESGVVLLDNLNYVSVLLVNPGIFYKDGRFLTTTEEYITIYKEDPGTGDLLIEQSMITGTGVSRSGRSTYSGRKLFSAPTRRIGYTIGYSAVNFTQDSTLLDNASGFSNERAPGADRLKVNLTLTQRDFNRDDPESYTSNDFIELGRIEKGVLKFIANNTQYSEILKLFAKRTYDESGSYTISPFNIDFKNHLKNDLFVLLLDRQFETDKVPQIGDLIFLNNFNNQDSSTRFGSNLLFPTETKTTTTQYYPKEVKNEPIGQIVSIIIGNKPQILVKPLNKKSFTTLPYSSTFAIKTANGGSYIDNVCTLDSESKVAPIQFELDSTGVYSNFDTPAGDANKFVATLSAGTAYVEGFEVDKKLEENVTLRRGVDLKRDVSLISPTEENVVHMTAENGTTGLFPNTIQLSNIANELVEVRSDSNLIQIDFVQIPETGYASGQVIDWVPFKTGSIVNKTTQNININNKDSILFITGDNVL